MKKKQAKPRPIAQAIDLMNKAIARAFARGRICRQTAEYFEISLGEALGVLGDIDQWETPTSELQY